MKIKFYLISFLLISFLFSCNNKCFAQQQKFEFLGQVKGIKNGHVEILVEPFTDSVFVKISYQKVKLENGFFKIIGNTSYPYLTRIIINDSIYSDPFFIEQGKIKGNFLIDSLGKLSVNIISKVNKEYEENYLPKVRLVNLNLDNWYHQHYIQQKIYPSGIPLSIEDSMQILRSNLISQKDTIIYNYINQNNKSYVGFWALVKSAGTYNNTRYQSFYSLDYKLQNTYTGQGIRDLLEGGKKVLVGSVFPEIFVQDTAEKVISLKKKTIAKYTLIDFWFSYCGPCIAQFPKFKQLHSIYNSKDFQILGVSVDTKEKRSKWLEAVKEHQLPWPQYWDMDAIQANDLGISGYPQNFLIDNNGKIIANNLELSQLESFLQANIK